MIEAPNAYYDQSNVFVYLKLPNPLLENRTQNRYT